MKTDSFCPACGAKQRPGATYCATCGASLAKASARTQARSGRRKQPQQHNTLLPILIAGALLVLVGGVLLLVNQNGASQTISPTQAVSQVPDEHSEDGLPYPEVPRVAAAQAKASVERGQALLIDVRSQGEYDTAHAQGARLLSLADLEARYRELPQSTALIFYCT